MNSIREEMSNRFLRFSVNIIELGKKLKKCYENRHIYEQLFRATTSAGANYEESHSAESGRDFLHKRLIVLKELRESFFWLKLIKYSRLINPKDSILLLLYNENEELIKIISKSISSSKNM